MNNHFLSIIMPILPKRLVSRLTGWFTRLRLPQPLQKFINSRFAQRYKIRLDEAELPLESYPSINALFTRKLKAGLRPIRGEWVHPSDAVMTQAGRITNGKLLQVKNWEYSLSDFLGNPKLATSYEGGFFSTYYLCPTDYHRVHAPLSGQLQSAKHIPGTLWPVNEWSVNAIKSLFNLNERVILNFTGDKGHWSVVLVGATNVGQMTITPDSSIFTNKWMWHAATDRTYRPPISVRVGDELGIFHMGSTVVCIYSRDFSGFDSLVIPQVTQVGQEVLRKVGSDKI